MRVKGRMVPLVSTLRPCAFHTGRSSSFRARAAELSRNNGRSSQEGTKWFASVTSGLNLTVGAASAVRQVLCTDAYLPRHSMRVRSFNSGMKSLGEYAGRMTSSTRMILDT